MRERFLAAIGLGIVITLGLAGVLSEVRAQEEADDETPHEQVRQLIAETKSACDATSGDEAGVLIEEAAAELFPLIGTPVDTVSVKLLHEFGLLAYGHKEYEVAHEAFDRVREYWVANAEPESEELQGARNDLAVLKRRLGDPEGALELQERVYEVRLRTLPDEHPDLDVIRSNLAVTRRQLGDLEGALVLRQEIYHALRRVRAPEDLELQNARRHLAAARKRTGDYQGALELHEEGYAILSNALQSDDPALLTARKDLAKSKWTAGDLKGVLELREEVYEVFRSSKPADDPEVLSAQEALALIRFQTGDLEGARDLQETVYELRLLTLPEDHRDLQMARRDLAATLADLGDLQASLELLEKACSVWMETLPETHPDLLFIQGDLAVVKQSLGDLYGTLEVEERVFEAYRKTRSEDDNYYLAAAANLAITKRALGDLLGALELQEQVYRVRVEKLPSEHPSVQIARNNLAATKMDLGDVEGALELLEQAVTVYEETVPDDHPHLLAFQGNLAEAKRASGDLEGALDLERHVYEVRRKSLPEDHPATQVARNNLASTHRARGEYARARDLDELTYRVRARLLPDDHPHLQASRTNLVETYLGLGEVELAHGVLAEAFKAHLARQLSLGGSVGWRAQAGDSGEARILSLLLSLPDDDGKRTVRFLECIASLQWGLERQVRARRVIQAAARGDSLLRSAVADTRVARARYYSAYHNDEKWDRVSELRQMLETAEARLVRLAATLPDWAGLAAVPQLETVLAALNPGSAVAIPVEYTRLRPNKDGDLVRMETTREVEAFVADSRGSVVRVALGSADSLALAVRVLSRGLAARTRSVKEVGGYPDSGGLRYEVGRLIEPMMRAIPDGTDALLVIPGGSLATVPWEAIPPGEGKALLGDRFQISYASNLSELSARGPDLEPSLLAFGGIAYGSVPDTLDGSGSAPEHFATRGRGMTWSDLEGSGVEVEAAAKLFGEAFPGAEKLLVTGTDASRASFVHIASSYRFVHLATHGFVAPRRDWSLEDELASGQRLSDRRRAMAYDRGLLAGVVFAGANRQASGTRVPGVLTASELQGMDLSRCELVVLSACETNVGPRHFGEAIAGLNRALHLAGARNTITSLWKVDDRGTADFFRFFYEALWGEGKPVKEAFRIAQKRTREMGYGPGVWAGFVLYTS